MKKLSYLLAMVVLVLSCAEEAPRKDYLAKVNGQVITEEDVLKEYEQLPPRIREMFSGERGMEGLLSELVKREILYLEAKKRGYARSGEFRNRVEEFKKRLLIELLLEEEVESKVEVSEGEVRDFYDQNRQLFAVQGEDGENVVEFDRVRGLIGQRLKAEKQKAAFDSYVGSLREAYRVELAPEEVRAAFGNRLAPTPSE